jgi:L-ascorbate metabolism protein UlaG (beta-lactamase superfamily)
MRLPAVDALVLSHPCCNHMDTETQKTLNTRHASYVLASLANGPALWSFAYPEEQIHCLHWWDSRTLALALPAANIKVHPVDITVEIRFTPAQHQLNRSVNGR